MTKRTIFIVWILLALVGAAVPSMVSGQDSPVIQRPGWDRDGTPGTGEGPTTCTANCDDERPVDEATGGHLLTYTMLTMLEAECRAFYRDEGRLPDNLTELRDSGWCIFEPVAHVQTAGLLLSDADVNINLRQLGPQEIEGGPEIMFAIDWVTSTIPGQNDEAGIIGDTGRPGPMLMESPVISQTGSISSEKLAQDVEIWEKVYTDINSNGIFLAGYDLDTSGMANPLDLVSQTRPRPMPRPPPPPDDESGTSKVNNSPQSWTFFYPEPDPLVGNNLIPREVDFRDNEYSFWKGDRFGYMSTAGDGTSSFEVIPWVLQSYTDTIIPGHVEPGTQSLVVSQTLLVMKACGIIIDNYIANNGINSNGINSNGLATYGIASNGMVPSTTQDLMGGIWEINSNGFINAGTIAPGDPGSIRMGIIIVGSEPGEDGIIIVQNTPAERGIIIDNRPADEKGIIIVENMPAASEASIAFYCAITDDRGQDSYFQLVTDPDTRAVSWDPTDFGDDFIVIVNGYDPLIDSALPGWGFSPVRMLQPVEMHFVQ